MAFIELVDFNENMAKTEAKKTRNRRSKKSAPKAEAPVETPAVEATETAE
jgi:large subunit ribosomal protein L17